KLKVTLVPGLACSMLSPISLNASVNEAAVKIVNCPWMRGTSADTWAVYQPTRRSPGASACCCAHPTPCQTSTHPTTHTPAPAPRCRRAVWRDARYHRERTTTNHETMLCSIVDTLRIVMVMLGARPRLSPCVNYRTRPVPPSLSGRGNSRRYPARPAPERR